MDTKRFVIDRLMEISHEQFQFATIEEGYLGGFKLTLPDVYPRHFGKTTKNKYNLPDKVMFNDKKGATTLLYHSQTRINDDKVTVVKTCEGDKFDKKFGFLLAYFQHNCGLSKTQANKYLKELVENE